MSYLQEIIEKHADPRVKNWYFMSSPLPTIILSLMYVIFVKKIGPHLMENRKPFHLKNVIIIYNGIQVVLSAYVFYALSRHGWLKFNSILCEPVDTKNNELMNAIWWYYFAKFTEFFDTIFFLLRKKYNQISTLHVFHHSVMPTIAWIGVKYAPGGTGTMFGVYNSFVHVIMYSYYMFAAMGPKYQKYLWWKRYLTIIQLIQFAVVILQSVIIIMSDCNINKIFSYSILIVVFAFLILFSDFYKKTYSKKPPKQTQTHEINYEKAGTSFMTLREQYRNSTDLKRKIS